MNKNVRQAGIILAFFVLDFILYRGLQNYLHTDFSIDYAIGIAVGAWLFGGTFLRQLVVLCLTVTTFLKGGLEPWYIAAITVLMKVALVHISSLIIERLLLNNELGKQLSVARFSSATFMVLICFCTFFIALEAVTPVLHSLKFTDTFSVLQESCANFLGVLLATPVTLFLLRKNSERLAEETDSQDSSLLPLSGLALIVLMLNLVSHNYFEEEKAEKLTTFQCDIQSNLQRKLALLEQKVTSVTKLFENRHNVSQQDFTNFVDWSVKTDSELLGFSWNRVVAKTQLDKYIQELAGEFPDTDVKAQTIVYPHFQDTDIAVIVERIFPFERWKNVIGLDVMTEEIRRNAIQAALNNHHLAYTESIELLQFKGTGQRGVLLFSFCCSPSEEPQGVAVGVVNATKLLNEVTSQLIEREHVLVHVDDAKENGNPLNYQVIAEPDDNQLHQSFDIKLQNQTWRARIITTEGYWTDDLQTIHVVQLLSIFLTIYVSFSVINSSIRRQQLIAKAASNEEFVAFIGRIEEIVHSTLSNKDELHTIADVYSSFLEANASLLFDRNGKLIADWEITKLIDSEMFSANEEEFSSIQRVIANMFVNDVVIRRLHGQLGGQKIVLIPWITNEHETVVMGFIVSASMMEDKLAKLDVLNQALTKVNEVRRQKVKADKLINHLKELNELLAEAERLGNVGSFKIDLSQNDYYFSPQVLSDFGIRKGDDDPEIRIWNSFKISERKKLIQAFRNKSGEDLFNVGSLPATRKFKVKWNSTKNESGVKATIFGVVVDVTEQVSIEHQRIKKMERDEFVKKVLHEMTFAIAGSNESLSVKIESIVAKARLLLGVSRCSVWLFENDNAQLTCKALATPETTISYKSNELMLKSEEFPQYFRAMQESTALIIPEEIDRHPCTAGMFEGYLGPLDIRSLSDFPIIEDNHVVGVICFEQQGAHWKPNQEQVLLGNTIAALLAKLFEAEEKMVLLNQLINQQHEREQILSSMVDAVITIDERGIIQTVNKATLDTFEYERSELIGNNINMLMSGENRRKHDGYLQNYVDGGPPKIVGLLGREVEGVTKSGKSVPLRLSVTEIEHHETKQRIFVGVLHDLTVESEQRKQIIHSEKMDALGLMTGGIAHDFNNILGIMLGYAEMILEDRDSAEDDIHKYAKQIEVAGERAKDLIAQIRTVSKTETLEQAILSSAEVIIGCQSMLEKAMASSSVKLVVGELDKNVATKLNKGDFENALLNLCINAMHASQPGDQVLISSEVYTLTNKDKIENGVNNEQMLRVSIKDWGVGMDREAQARMFEPFYSTKGESGTGLGLAQVYGFVQRSNGFVSVKSALGEGTTINLYLPISSQAPEESKFEDKTKLQKVSDYKTILVAEDEDSLRNILSHKLRALGYTVFEAKDGEEAIEVLKNIPIDLVLSDVLMPNKDGIELANHIYNCCNDTKVQLMSGYSDMRHVNLLDEKLYHNRIVKPFKLSEVMEIVQGHLAE